MGRGGICGFIGLKLHCSYCFKTLFYIAFYLRVQAALVDIVLCERWDMNDLNSRRIDKSLSLPCTPRGWLKWELPRLVLSLPGLSCGPHLFRCGASG